jgi:hypothetical protein
MEYFEDSNLPAALISGKIHTFRPVSTATLAEKVSIFL